jgi:phosphoribosyl 1,2-cyclic phosphodiesterase
MDPLTLRQRLPSAPEVDISAFAMLDYVVLTHRHADHLDLGLLRLLRDFPVHWIIPESLIDTLRILNLPRKKLTIVYPLEPIPLDGLTLTPFDGQHWEAAPDYPDRRRGVPATGYLAEFNGKRWLFPGDIRTYDANLLPVFGPVDGLIIHLWLGRGQALEDRLPLLDAFGRFWLDLKPRRVVVTHLEEFGRPPSDYWDEGHFHVVEKWFQRHGPCVSIGSARMGDTVELL